MAKWSADVEYKRSVRKGLNLAKRAVWDRAASRQVGELARAVIGKRAFDDGLGSDDQPMKGYSTSPYWHRNTGGVSGGRRTRVKGKGGRSKFGKGRFYAGGYREYKRATSGSSKVNLTETGRMRRSFRVKRATKSGVSVGLTGGAVIYGTFVNRLRPWSALSKRDRAIINAAIPRIAAGAARRSKVTG